MKDGFKDNHLLWGQTSREDPSGRQRGALCQVATPSSSLDPRATPRVSSINDRPDGSDLHISSSLPSHVKSGGDELEKSFKYYLLTWCSPIYQGAPYCLVAHLWTFCAFGDPVPPESELFWNHMDLNTYVIPTTTTTRPLLKK